MSMFEEEKSSLHSEVEGVVVKRNSPSDSQFTKSIEKLWVYQDYKIISQDASSSFLAVNY